MRHGSHCTQDMNTGVVYWLNVGNWKLLSCNINCAVSAIPGSTSTFCYLLFVSLYKSGGHVRAMVRVSGDSHLLRLYSDILNIIKIYPANISR